MITSRTLGLACMVGSSIALVDGLRLVATGHKDIPGFRDIDGISAIAQAFWALGLVCAFLGLLALHATGDRAFHRWLTWIPVVGGILAALGFVLVIVGVPTSKNLPAIVGQLLSMLGLLVVTVLVLVARNWEGWRRLTPLVVFLAIPFGAALVEATKLDGAFIILNSAASLPFGYAVFSTRRAATVREATPDTAPQAS